VRRVETERLKRKLSGLSETDRHVAEAVIADVIGTLALFPARALADDLHPRALQAIVHLFGLDVAQDA
jgi:hypothetical protein